MGVQRIFWAPKGGRRAVFIDARCAIVAGLALAQEQVVALFDSSGSTWPIDYRDIIVTYSNPGQIKQLLEGPVRPHGRLHWPVPRHQRRATNILQKIDLAISQPE